MCTPPEHAPSTPELSDRPEPDQGIAGIAARRRTAPQRRAILPKGPITVAQRVVVTLADDIDGGEASETVAFGLDGKTYEIDLSPDNASRLRTALAPYVQAGRKRTRTGKAFHHTSVAPDPRAVRAWAESNGMQVPARGRIPKKVYDAFNEAH